MIRESQERTSSERAQGNGRRDDNDKLEDGQDGRINKGDMDIYKTPGADAGGRAVFDVNSAQRGLRQWARVKAWLSWAGASALKQTSRGRRKTARSEAPRAAVGQAERAQGHEAVLLSQLWLGIVSWRPRAETPPARSRSQ